MDFSGTEPSLLVPEARSWDVTSGHRVDKGGVSWGDVACGRLRSQNVVESPPPNCLGPASLLAGPKQFSGLAGFGRSEATVPLSAWRMCAKRRFLSPHGGCVRSDGSSLRMEDVCEATVPYWVQSTQ
jgi:hypothetical protein